MKFVKRKAFSLLEISIVIIIIGVLIAGFVQAIEMFSEASLKSARNLSKLSRVSRIEDLTLWLDATSSESFDKEKDNNSTVSIWKDTNASAGSIISSSSSLASLYPSYASSAINKLPAVSFKKTSSLVGNCVTVPNGSFVNSSEDFTLYLIFSPKTLDDGIIIEKNNASATTFPFSLELLSGSYKFSVKNSTETISVIGSIKAKINTPNLIRLSRIKGSQIEIAIDGISSTETDTLTSSTLNNAELAIGCRNGTTPANFINGDIGETAFYNRNLNLKDKSDIEEYLYKKWKMKKFEGTLLTKTCNAPNANTTIDATSVNFTNIPISITCKEGYLGSPTYTCTGTGNLGTYYPGGTPCTAITCTAPASNGYLAQSSLAYTTTGSPGTITCDQGGYSGSVSYTCTASGPATVTGSCAATTCTAPASNGYLAQSLLAYKTAGSPGAITCDQAGYTGSVSYTCTTTGPATVTGTCTAITCTAPASNGYLAQSLLAYKTAGSGVITCDQAGYTGSVSYTCTATGPATVTGSCTSITCTAPESNGYLAQSLLAYKTAGSPGTITCDQAGYTGSVSYTCTTTGPASITGSCTANTCTAPASNGYLAQSLLAYKTAGSPGTITCDQAGYTGSVSYTCTATGPASVTGTCTAITCTAPESNGYLAQSLLAYKTAGSPGTITCDQAGYTGSVSYTCTTTGPATVTGSCAATTCTVPTTTNTTIAGTSVNPTTTVTPLTCKPGFFGSPKYTCSATGTYAADGIPCAPIKCYAKERVDFVGTNYVDVVLSVSSEMIANSSQTYIDNNMGRSLLPLVNRLKLYDVYHGGVSYVRQNTSWTFFGPINLSYVQQSANVSAFRSMGVNYYGIKSNHVLTKYSRILDYGTNSFTCDYGYTGTLTYNCQTDGSTLDPSSGTCSMVTCNVPFSTNSTIDNTAVNFTSSPVSITCKSGFPGSPSYTCLPNGSSPTGIYVPGGVPCSANNCTVPAIHNFNITSTGLATNATPVNCATGYAYGSIQPSYTCDTSTTPGTFTKVSGNCSPITCTVPASENTTSTGSAVDFSASPVSLTCASGFYGAQKYTCLSNGNSLSGLYTSVGIPCAPIKCYAKERVGFSGTNYFDNVSAGTGNIEAWSSLFKSYHENQSSTSYIPLVNRIKLFDVYHGPLIYQSQAYWYIFNFNPIDRSQFSKTSYPSYFIYQSPELYNVKASHTFTKYARILGYGNNITVNCDSGFTGTLTYNCQTDGSTLDPTSGSCTAN